MICNHKHDMNEQDMQEMHDHLRSHLASVSGEDVRGIEISSAIRMMANLYESAFTQKAEPNELSGPRMGILIRLLADQDRGNLDGMNPTTISRFQRVKKNTISSLLRGLEQDGYIQRTLDPVDKRVFRIRVTDKGRKMIETTTPMRMRYMNKLTSELTDEEKDQFLVLIAKLHSSVKKNMPAETPAGENSSQK